MQFKDRTIYNIKLDFVPLTTLTSVIATSLRHIPSLLPLSQTLPSFNPQRQKKKINNGSQGWSRREAQIRS